VLFGVARRSLLVAGGDVCSLAGGRILSGYLLIRGML
jgi:hypothetical protein